MSVSFDQK